MPFLFWFPMIIAAGLYEAASQDVTNFQRAWLGRREE
jgi:hypothetical protein